MFTFEEIFDGSMSYSIQQSLMSCLDTICIMRLGQTCRVMARVCGEQWDIRALFARYDIVWELFRERMRMCAAVVSGVPVLLFLDRNNLESVWRKATVDVFAPEGEMAEEVESYLECECGYARESDRRVYVPLCEEFHAGVSSVKYLVKEVNGAERRIRLMGHKKLDWTSDGNAERVEELIHCVYGTTAAKNLITADRVCSLYPWTTFLQHCTVRTGGGWDLRHDWCWHEMIGESVSPEERWNITERRYESLGWPRMVKGTTLMGGRWDEENMDDGPEDEIWWSVGIDTDARQRFRCISSSLVLR
jgi:hypothetical protein